MKISFVIPVRNNKRYLRKCVQSILAQSISPSEVIVVDNGSTDGGAETIADLDARIISEPRQGRSIARNRGWRESSGDLVAFIDSDVILDVNWTQEIIKIFDLRSVGGGQGQVIPAGEKDTSLQRYRYRIAELKAGLFSDLAGPSEDFPAVNTAACCYRKTSLQHVSGFNEDLEVLEDVDLSRRIFRSGWSLRHAPESKAYCYWHGKGWPDYALRGIRAYSHRIRFKHLWGELVTEEEKNERLFSLWWRKMKFTAFPKLEGFELYSFFWRNIISLGRKITSSKLLYTQLAKDLKTPPPEYPLHPIKRFGYPNFVDNGTTIYMYLGKSEWLNFEGKLRNDFYEKLQFIDSTEDSLSIKEVLLWSYKT